MAQICIKTPHQADNYVFIPACCYAGNQFDVRTYAYPPMFTAQEARVDMPVTITDVPRLNPDGSGKIEVTTGDAAVPCVGVFSPSERRGVLVFTAQEIDGQNIGLAYESGSIRLTWPAKRKLRYFWSQMHPNEEPWVDVPADIPHHVLDFPCNSLAEFYRVFFENRKIMALDDKRPAILPFDKQFEIQRNKFNTMNWIDQFGIYSVGTDRSRFQVWQPGWVGGAMSGYALMKLGGEQEWQREMRTLDFLFSTQAESGFFHGVVDADGAICGDAFGTAGAERWHLIRKSADVLYFLTKHFTLMKARGVPIPAAYWEGAKRTADSFVRLWEKYGQFGQFVDVQTGEIRVGGSTSGAIAPAGLAGMARLYGAPVYLRVAEESARLYQREHLAKGYTTGGPGEILQCVDSESAFGLLESFVVLYDVTGAQQWLDYASACACYCSSWVVSYNYRFPETSEFGRLGMKTVGSVFANLQNKHSAPGICTLSGDSLWRLFQWTGDRLFLELLKDIALTISQYMSTEQKPIYDWELTPQERENGDAGVLDTHRLPQGFICERVNMSDWETQRCVGGVFCGSCWSETSNLLALAEVVPLLEQAGELDTVQMIVE